MLTDLTRPGGHEGRKEIEMVKRTYKNFLQTMEILQNQCYMPAGEAERRARQIFDNVEYDRKNRKVKSTVEDYLTAEINMAISMWSAK